MFSSSSEQSLGLVSAVLLLFSMSSIIAADSDLANLCNGNLVKISRISQAKALVEASKSTRENSCEQFKRSLAKLEPILDKVVAGNGCQQDLVEMVHQFHDKFIASKSFLLPEAMRHFFVSLSSAISSKCKALLTNQLKADTDGRITEEDYFSMPLDQSDQLNQLNSEEVLLAEDIKKLLAKKHSGKFSMLVSVEVGEKFRELVAACETKFKPVYSQLVVPIITLSKLGYGNVADEKDNLLLSKWIKIVQVCESLSAADVFGDTANLVKDKTSITFVSKDKAAELRKTQLSVNEAVARDEHQIEFAPTAANLILDDEMPAVNLKELEKHIAEVNKSHGIKSMVKKQIKAKLRNALASGKMRFKSLSSLKCPAKGNCEAKLSDVSENALNATNDERGLRRRKREMVLNGYEVGCIIFFPCAMVAFIIIFIVMGLLVVFGMVLDWSKNLAKNQVSKTPGQIS